MRTPTHSNLIQTPFGFDSTAAQVSEGIDLSGKRAIVTGGSSGIGIETARALAGAGAEVTLAVRDTGAGDRAAADITATTDNAVHVGRLDLSDQGSVAGFVANWSGPLHILINNAGVIFARPPTDRRGLGHDVRERLDVSLYARDPIALVTKLSARALEADVPYAVTGATGAAALGAPVSTAVPITLVRVAPDVPSLAEAAQLLGVEPVDAGANMALIRDVGELGLHGRVSSGSVYVAPPVRIWLDMLGEPRGEDAAALFREAVIGW